MNNNDTNHITQAIMRILGKSQQSGHLFLNSDELCRDVAALLKINTVGNVGNAMMGNPIQRQLLKLVLDGRLCEDDGRIYLPKNFIAERETAKLIRAMIGTTLIEGDADNVNNVSNARIAGDIDEIIAQAEKDCSFTLAEMQRMAVKMAITNNISMVIAAMAVTAATSPSPPQQAEPLGVWRRVWVLA